MNSEPYRDGVIMTSKTKQLTLATTEAVKHIGQTVHSAMNPGGDTYTPESPTQARTLQYTRRGLKMVGEKSVFDLKEPIWHPDEKASLYLANLLPEEDNFVCKRCCVSL